MRSGRKSLSYASWVLGILLLGTQDTAVAQAPAELVRHRVLLPKPRLETGYLAPPVIPLGADGVVALDAMDDRVVVLEHASGEGRLVSRRGEGPGEFLAASSLLVRGDSLILTDLSLQRASVFNIRTGTLITTWPLDTEVRWAGGLVRPLVGFQPDCWLGTTSRTTRQAENNRQPFRTVQTVVRVRMLQGRRQVDSIISRDSRDAYIHPLGELVVAKVPSVVATRPQFVLSPDGKGFATFTPVDGRRSGVAVKRWPDACGTRSDSSFLPIPQRELTPQQVRTFYRAKLSGRPTVADRLEAAIDDALDQTRTVNGRYLAPLFSGAFLGGDGTVWVEVEGVADVADYGSPRVWWRLGPGRQKLSPVIVPPRVRLQAASAQGALGWVTTEAGGEIVELRWR